MPSPIIPVMFLKFYCVRDSEVHSLLILVADKWVAIPSVIKIGISRNASYFFLSSYIATFVFLIINV